MKTNEYIGISCFTVAITCRGEQSQVAGTTDMCTAKWLEQVVLRAISLSTPQKADGLELAVSTAKSQDSVTTIAGLPKILSTTTAPERKAIGLQIFNLATGNMG